MGGSTSRCQRNINDEPEFDDVEIKQEQRPIGRDKAKREATAKKQATSRSGSSSKLYNLMAELKVFTQTFSETQVEKVRVKKHEVEEKLRLKAKATQLEEWKIMTTDISAYPEQERLILQKMKDKIAKKWSS